MPPWPASRSHWCQGFNPFQSKRRQEANLDRHLRCRKKLRKLNLSCRTPISQILASAVNRRDTSLGLRDGERQLLLPGGLSSRPNASLIEPGLFRSLNSGRLAAHEETKVVLRLTYSRAELDSNPDVWGVTAPCWRLLSTAGHQGGFQGTLLHLTQGTIHGNESGHQDDGGDASKGYQDKRLHYR